MFWKRRMLWKRKVILEKPKALEMVNVQINGTTHTIEKGTRILDYLLSQEIQHPHICYSEILGPVQSCDTCMCEVNGTITRACSTVVEGGMDILTSSELAKQAQEEAMGSGSREPFIILYRL